MSREIKFRFYGQNQEGRISIGEQSLEDIENEDSWQGPSPWKRIATPNKLYKIGYKQRKRLLKYVAWLNKKGES